MKRGLVACLALGALALVGCSSSGTPEPAPTVTVTVPGPVVTVTAEPAAPAPVAEGAATFEALGSGEATVIYSSGGGQVQREVTLPFTVQLEPSSLGTHGVVNGSGAVGCRLTVGGAVVDETPPTDGQHYAECTD